MQKQYNTQNEILFNIKNKENSLTRCMFEPWDYAKSKQVITQKDQ